MLHTSAELVSLFLTVPGIILSVLVLFKWVPAGIKLVYEPLITSAGWITLGVILKFFFDILDSGYWFGAWGADFLRFEIAQTLFKNGVYANIPFRQMGLIIAAYCHLRAFYEMYESESTMVNKKIKKDLYISILLGIVVSIWFVWMRVSL